MVIRLKVEKLILKLPQEIALFWCQGSGLGQGSKLLYSFASLPFQLE